MLVELSAMHIRPFTPADYAATVALGNICYPDHASTVDEAKWGDSHRDPACVWGRFVGTLADGTVIGLGDYGQWTPKLPHTFYTGVMVHPDCRRLGHGAALYKYLLAQLAPHVPQTLRAHCREDKPEAVAFLLKNGFAEEMREYESHLAIPGFDFAPYADDRARFANSGITIKTLRDLESDPHRNRKLYDLANDLHEDVPSPEPHIPRPFDLWVQRFENPNYLPDANFVALDGEKYVGMSTLHKQQASDHLFTGLTGVLRDYRRQGIALALKLRAVEYAVAAGAPIVRTGNEINNRGMLAINERLGFVLQPAWISWANHLTETETEAIK